MGRKSSILICAVLALSIVLAGCGGSTPPAGGEKPPVSEAWPARDGMENTFIIGSNEAKGEFIPVYYSTVYDGYVIELLFDQLFTNDAAGELIPAVAEKWEISEDKRTYTFELRDDVKFTDGSPLTAGDVEFTYLTMADPNYDGRYVSLVSDIEGYDEYHEDTEGKVKNMSGIKVIDPHTISFTFAEPMVTNIYNLNQYIMPKHYYGFDKGDMDSLKKLMQKPLGSGKYIMDTFEPKQFITFKANPNFYAGAPKTENLIIKFTTVETMIQELQKGTVDAQVAVAPNPENKEMIDEPGFLTINDYDDNGYGYMGFNLRDPRLSDKIVRQALTYGFDRQGFVDVYYKGFAVVSNAPVSAVSWAYTEDVNKYEYDPDKAAAMLDEAGWKVGADGIREKDGMKLSFVWDTYTDSNYVQTMIPMLKDNWSKIGVKVEANLMDFNSLVEKVYTDQDFDMYNMAWSLVVDPDFTDIFHSREDIPDGNNAVGLKSAHLDELLESGRKEFDFEKRKKITQEAVEFINEELPYMFLTMNINWDVHSTRVKNFETSPFVSWAMIAHKIELAK